eukprot:XP_001709838.1 Hypothetical protein GL50803_91032 [Giardia lamblia ATCC 50803]
MLRRKYNLAIIFIDSNSLRWVGCMIPLKIVLMISRTPNGRCGMVACINRMCRIRSRRCTLVMLPPRGRNLCWP